MSFRVGRTVKLGSDGVACNNFINNAILIVALVALPLWVVYVENNRYEMTQAFKEARRNLVVLPDSSQKLTQLLENQPEISTKPVYASSRIILPGENIVDTEFNLDFGNALAVKRVPEYCQWDETYTDTTNEETNEVSRTYYYTKSWHSYRINSLFFNQPGAHYNPQNDPFPAYEFITPYAVLHSGNDSKTAVQYDVSSAIIRKATTFKSKQMFSKDDYTRFKQSYAGTDGDFRPIGQGYFYYAHKRSMQASVFKIALEVMEGSILDYQIGDLFSVCNAGDIRIRFEVFEPKGGVSVIGSFQQTSDNGGIIDTFTNSRNFPLGIIQEGYKMPPKVMFKNKLRAKS
ncbi:hypothetical protein HK098_002280 [Nowakowskiella sp. JEL0407]|nr:hypothetical protein HK098_002280 [Nowakowskiella sp. JEL0407]